MVSTNNNTMATSRTVLRIDDENSIHFDDKIKFIIYSLMYNSESILYFVIWKQFMLVK